MSRNCRANIVYTTRFYIVILLSSYKNVNNNFDIIARDITTLSETRMVLTKIVYVQFYGYDRNTFPAPLIIDIINYRSTYG